jgi:hypothetical protein
MPKKIMCAAAVIFAVLGASPGVSQERWVSFRFAGGFSEANAKTLANWINDTCRPDEMGNIVGFSYQTSPGAPLALQVFCRQGGSGKLGKVKVVKNEFSSDFEFRQKSLGPMQNAVIVGFDLAKAGSVMDPPTGTAVMVVRE